MHSEFRHAYLQYIGVRVGGEAIAVDYQLTVYWGQVISISETGFVTLKYYAGVTKGYKTKEFHPYRCYGNPYDERQPPNGHLQTWHSVMVHFREYVIPKLKAFPERYDEIERLNNIIYCEYCAYDEEYCNCPRCEDCGSIVPYECRCDFDDILIYGPDPDIEDLREY